MTTPWLAVHRKHLSVLPADGYAYGVEEYEQ